MQTDHSHRWYNILCQKEPLVCKVLSNTLRRSSKASDRRDQDNQRWLRRGDDEIEKRVLKHIAVKIWIDALGLSLAVVLKASSIEWNDSVVDRASRTWKNSQKKKLKKRRFIVPLQLLSVFFVGTKIDDERGEKTYDVVYLDIFIRYILYVLSIIEYIHVIVICKTYELMLWDGNLPQS